MEAPVTARVFLSPDEQRLEQLPGREGELFKELHEIGAHLVTDEPEPWRHKFNSSKPTVAREVCK